MPVPRRAALSAAATFVTTLAAPALVRAAEPEIVIGYWPVAAGLPLFAGVARNVFGRAGLTVRAQKFASAQQVIEGMIAGRLHGSANGVASGLLMLGQLTDPGLCKIVCANPSNVDLVLDEVIVAADSPYRTIADLAGKPIASGPGIQNVTLARIIMEKNGYPDARPIELPLGQHVPALVAGQIAGAYTLEPTGTLGAMKGLTRTLEAGVIARYVLGDPHAPWFGGAACVTRALMEEQPALARRYVAAYAEAVALVRRDPDGLRPELVGNTGIGADLAARVPLPGFRLYNEFSAADLDAFQAFFDVLTARGVARARVPVRDMIYAA